MSKCGINGDLIRLNECESPSEGTADVALIGKLQDIIRFTKGSNIPAEISSRVYNGAKLKFTKKFFQLEGRNDSIQGMNNFEGTGVLGKYSHDFNFQVYSDEPEMASRLQELNNGKAVAIYQTNNQKFKIAGKDSGLVTQTGNQDTSLADNGGTYAITMKAKAKSYTDYLAIYAGTLPTSTYNYESTQQLFDTLKTPTKWAISAISVGTTTTITLSDTLDNPYVNEAEIGTLVRFEGIVGTVGTDGVNGLNNKSFAIATIIDNKTFTITAVTTGLVYGSGGTAQ